MFLLPVVSLLLIVCTANDARPEAGPDRASSRYMSAEGIGQSEGEARNQARAELSRIFESQVLSDTFDRVTSVIDTSGEETSTQSLESRIRVVSEVELKGVEISKTWRENGYYHAIAVLDRYKARDNWLSELKDIDNAVEGKLKAIESTDGRLIRYRSLLAVSEIWINREVIASRLRVLGFGKAALPGYDMKSVFRRLAGIKADMPVYVDIKGSHGALAREIVSGALGRSGFVVTEDRSEGAVLITGNVKVSPVELDGSDLKYARAVVSLAIVDTDAGLSVGEVSENKRAAYISYAEAVEKALKKVLPSVSRKIIECLEAEGPKSARVGR
jgi:hypothetical protein